MQQYGGRENVLYLQNVDLAACVSSNLAAAMFDRSHHERVWQMHLARDLKRVVTSG